MMPGKGVDARGTNFWEAPETSFTHHPCPLPVPSFGQMKQQE
jgi:hypothetical protein